MKKQVPDDINYAMISFLEYVFAILVILLHAQRIFSNDVLHFIQKSIFSRMAVPFFLLSTSFFIKLNEKKNSGKGLDNYLQKSYKTYLYLSFLYLPYAIVYFLSLGITVWYMPLGFVVAVVYLGMCYHLWYFPASFLGLKLTAFLTNRLSRKAIFIICSILYLLGSVETYSAYLNGTKILEIYDLYKQYFLTTRNGLFYVPIFIFLGQIAFEYRDEIILKSHPLAKLVISFMMFLIEGSIVYMNQGYDKNFMISLVPFTLFLFNWANQTSLFKDKKWFTLKLYSRAYFFYHPIFIEMGFLMVKHLTVKAWEKGVFVNMFTLVSTHIVALVLTFRRQR